MKRISLLTLIAVIAVGVFTYAIAADHLLITEFCVTPTNGEFVEIYNPTGSTVDLTHYYLTDDSYKGNNDYIYVVNGATNVYSADFLVQFPSGASIGPGEYQTISIQGGDDFYGQYSVYPTYELKSQNASVPDMIPIDVSSGPTLSNSGEMIMLFYWDGSSDLVKDVDYVIWGDKTEYVDKTGVSIDGPDPDSDPSTYSADTDSLTQTTVDPDGGGGQPHSYGKTAQRSGITEATETLTGGNGITGNDETSEDMSVSGGSWTVDATASPGQGYGVPEIDAVEWSPYVPTVTEPVVVKAVVTDPAKSLDSVLVIYTIDGEDTTSLQMSLATGDTFQATIPQQANGKLVEFRVKAWDNDGNSSVYPYKSGYFSGTVSISRIRENDTNGVNIYKYYGARVTGVATLETGILREQGNGVDFYIQDATGGINVFDYSDASSVARGDSLIVAGRIYQYNGNLEITKEESVPFITNLGPGTLPNPTIMTCADWGEDYEGLLVAVPYVSNAGTGDPWPGLDTSADIAIFDTALVDTVYIRIDNGTNIDGWPEPTWPKDVVGIFSQYDMSLPYTWYYQLLPRDTADFLPAGSVGIVQPIAQSSLPELFSLSQNYPNPFNPTTQISFSLPTKGLVRLSIYNIVGQEVAELVNKELDTGSYQVSWDARSFSSGVYFYKIEAGDYQMTKKMVLLK